MSKKVLNSLVGIGLLFTSNIAMAAECSITAGTYDIYGGQPALYTNCTISSSGTAYYPFVSQNGTGAGGVLLATGLTSNVTKFNPQPTASIPKGEITKNQYNSVINGYVKDMGTNYTGNCTEVTEAQYISDDTGAVPDGNYACIMVPTDSNKIYMGGIVHNGSNFTQTQSKSVMLNIAPSITEGSNSYATVSQNSSPVVFDLTLNATDDDNDTLTWSIDSNGSYGTASVSATPTGNSQAINYTPTQDYSGKDTFIVKVSDGKGGSDTIKVNVKVLGSTPVAGYTHSFLV